MNRQVRFWSGIIAVVAFVLGLSFGSAGHMNIGTWLLVIAAISGIVRWASK